MNRRMTRLVCGVTVVAAAGLAAEGRLRAQRGAPDGEWREYAGDSYGMKYSPLSQIDAGNVSTLQIAWRWASADRDIQKSDPRLRASRYEDTPLFANGVLYTVTPLGFVAALDPATGKERWVYNPETYKTGRHFNTGFMVRGFNYWTDGTRERLFIPTNDAYLISIDTRSGKPDPAFGTNGRVDFAEGITGGVQRAVNFAARRGVVAGNVVVVGSSVSDTPVKSSPKGDIKAYDVRSGKLLWVFHTVPKKGEFGYRTWLEGSAEYTGSANAWAGMAYDPELDYVYIPTSTPTSDYFGGYRPGDNLFAESLVCLEAKTGKRVWHFQAVHHGLWDYDFPSHPTLGEVTVDGRRVKAVFQISKQNYTYAFDRRTGKPLWPIVETNVPQNTVANLERTSPTQPIPSKPRAYDLQGSMPENLIDATPELKARALAQLKQIDYGPLFSAPTERGVATVPSSLGGANWGGAAFDPDTGILYVPSRTTSSIARARYPGVDPDNPIVNNPPEAARGSAPAPAAALPAGSHAPNPASLLAMDGLPIFKPPYARVTAIDMNNGEHVWMTPLGNGPRNHPLLKDLHLPPLGDPILGASPLVTKSLLFVAVTNLWVYGQPQPPAWARYADADASKKLVYVFDKQNGHLLHVLKLDEPSNVSASAPMTYLHDGKQYLVVATGGAEDCELIAFTLPGASDR
jgi:quinoprotein glucose dehydrogenase